MTNFSIYSTLHPSKPVYLCCFCLTLGCFFTTVDWFDRGKMFYIVAISSFFLFSMNGEKCFVKSHMGVKLSSHWSQSTCVCLGFDSCLSSIRMKKQLFMGFICTQNKHCNLDINLTFPVNLTHGISFCIVTHGAF